MNIINVWILLEPLTYVVSPHSVQEVVPSDRAAVEVDQDCELPKCLLFFQREIWKYVRLWVSSSVDLEQPISQAENWMYGYLWANILDSLRVYKTYSYFCNVSTSKSLLQANTTLRGILYKTAQSVRYMTIESNVCVSCVQVWPTISCILCWRRDVDSWRVWTCAALPTSLQTMPWTLLVGKCMHGAYLYYYL